MMVERIPKHVYDWLH